MGILLAIVIAVFYVMNTYNGLVKLRNMVENAWAQVNVQLKRRIDLIPNIVETVKGYAKHESETLEKVIASRNLASTAKTTDEAITANNELTKNLHILLNAVSESYPDLKANTNFIQLQNDLKDTEDKIAVSRQFYNDIVTKFNTNIQVFPANFVANMFKFTKQTLFEITEADREVPKVKF